MKLNELVKIREDFAIGIPEQYPDFNESYSGIIGSIDARDVWSTRCWKNKDVFAFRTNNDLEAFIAIDTSNSNGPYYLNRAWCNSKYRGRGLITALLGFFTKKMQNQLHISDEEPLTPDGFNWLYKLVKSPHGFAIHDGKGGHIDAEEFKSKWEASKEAGQPQPMTIVIENFRSGKLFGNAAGTLWESIQYIGDSEID